MEFNGKRYSLDNSQMLYRGCVLRNTPWCYGLVVFAGRDTKLMMNSGETTFKRTHIDRLMNFLIMGIFGFLSIICLFCTFGSAIWEIFVGYDFQIILPWEDFIPGTFNKPHETTDKTGGAIITGILVFLSYIIVLNTVVPISLYVSVEMIRFGHSWWINWDTKMYDVESDTPAKSRTTTLNEELGQIKYIFSDKTGTLTRVGIFNATPPTTNIMTFDKCSINGKAYGDPVDEYGNAMDVTDKTPIIDFSDNPYSESAFRFYDKRLLDNVIQDHSATCDFFTLLSLCHTVMSENKNDQLEYQAQSPDEAALVSAARNFGFVFLSRTPTEIVVEINGAIIVYELLCILDFNNIRKRMSVIVKQGGQITLYCKGADTTVYQHIAKDRENNNMKELTTSHLTDFANDGLRTLCLAKKEINSEYYDNWKMRYDKASTSMDDRESEVEKVYNEIEEDMTLMGATAIEDKLQEGVPETIHNLSAAGINIWMLTGDKQETAINIGYSCKLLTDDLEDEFVIDGETSSEVEEQIKKAVSEMKIGMKGNEAIPGEGQRSYEMDNISYREDALEYAVVINGHSLEFLLEGKLQSLLLEAGTLAKSVICCRVTPLQKAKVVDLAKVNYNGLTLAIGDGANDVSMIKMAHIGVGISGQEGMQAVLSSDFSIAQFRFLERLLLVHGRWSYLRMCKFLKYFFYKNFAFTLCHFWYAFSCGFSAQTLFDPYFVSFYNLFYTALPVLMMGIFDQDLSDRFSLAYPKLYTPGHRDLLFNKKVFAQSAVEGIVTSVVLFYVPYAAFYNAIRSDGEEIVSHHAFGCTVASILIVTVTLRCALETAYWTIFNHVVIWGSIIFYFAFSFVFYSDFFGYSYVGTARNVMATANFWLTLVLTVTILLLPVVAERFYLMDTRPTLTDRVRYKMRRLADERSPGVVVATASSSSSSSSAAAARRSGVQRPGTVLRRHSTLRRSTRSMNRSGYAFSHQEGFGRLITTGTNMIASIASTARLAKQRTPFANHSKTGRISGSDVADSGHHHRHAHNHRNHAHHGFAVGVSGGGGGGDGDDDSIRDGRYRLKPMSPVAPGFTTPFQTRLTLPSNSKAARLHHLQQSPHKIDDVDKLESDIDGPSPCGPTPIPSPSGSIPSPSGSIPSPSGSIPSLGVPIPSPSGSIPSPSGPIPSPSGPIPSPSGPIPSPSGPIPSPSGPIPSPSGPIPSPSGPIPSPSGPTPSPSGSIPSPNVAEENIGGSPESTPNEPSPNTSATISTNPTAIPTDTSPTSTTPTNSNSTATPVSTPTTKEPQTSFTSTKF